MRARQLIYSGSMSCSDAAKLARSSLSPKSFAADTTWMAGKHPQCCGCAPTLRYTCSIWSLPRPVVEAILALHVRKGKKKKARHPQEAGARWLEARGKPWAPQFDGDRPETGQDTGDRSIRFGSPRAQLCSARSGVSGCVGPHRRKAFVQRARQRPLRRAIGRVIAPSIVPEDGAAVPQNRRGCHAREVAGGARRARGGRGRVQCGRWGRGVRDNGAREERNVLRGGTVGGRDRRDVS